MGTCGTGARGDDGGGAVVLAVGDMTVSEVVDSEVSWRNGVGVGVGGEGGKAIL